MERHKKKKKEQIETVLSLLNEEEKAHVNDFFGLLSESPEVYRCTQSVVHVLNDVEIVVYVYVTTAHGM